MRTQVALSRGLEWLLSGGGPGVVVALVVVAQFLVPAIAIRDPPTRFGFQMYSGLGNVTVTVVDPTGGTREIEPSRYAIDQRAELDWTRRLPEFVCAHLDVVSVTVAQGDNRRSLTCAR
ncbi:MAG: hypothetical protein H0T17_04205 [Propionibacteriales bacterium]|nr:hypothetical protein [Propionibacteriales bacterium]